MAKKGGQTDSPQTVEIKDEADLAEVLRKTLELEEVQKTDETPDEVPAEAEAEEGNESEVVLSQPELEAEAEDEPAADEHATEADAGDDEADDANDAEEEPPRGVQKRIDKLTKRAKEAEEKLAAETVRRIEAESAEPETVVTAPVTPANPFANLVKLEDVQKEEHNAEHVLEWCEDNPDGGVVNTSNGEVEYSAEEVREMRKQASKAIRKWLPQRTQWVQEYQQNEQYANTAYKWWNDKATNEYQTASSILRAFPEIQKFPDYKIIVGDTLVGMNVRLGAERQVAKPAPAAKSKKAPKQPTKPTAEPAPVDESAARSSSARQRFSESGDVDDLKELIKMEI
jgi:hypothetical protein